MSIKINTNDLSIGTNDNIVKDSIGNVASFVRSFGDVQTEDIPLTIADYNDLNVNNDFCPPMMGLDFTIHEQMRNLDLQDKIILLNTVRREEKKLPRFEIKEVSFQVTSSEYIEKLTGNRVIYKKYDAKDSSVQPATINDPRLGVVKGQSLCQTCLKDELLCPGHEGRIELYEPIINPLYRREVISILISVCNTCGKLLLTKEQIEDLPLDSVTAGKTRLKLLEGYLSGKKFKHEIDIKPEECFIEGIEIETGPTKPCYENPKYSLDKDDALVGKIYYKIGDQKRERTVDDIIKIFSYISPEDSKLMGLGETQPIDLIMKYLLVLPPIRRGENIFEGTMESDKMGAYYNDIIKLNEDLKLGIESYIEKQTKKRYGDIRKRKTPEELYEDDRKKLYQKIVALLTSKEAESFRGKPLQSSVKKQMQGKEGYIRQYTMGKKVNFTARSVIGPNPALEFGQVGIPMVFAPYLTVPVRVVDFNKDALNRLLKDGKISHLIKDPEFTRNPIKITNKNIDSIELEIGDEVWRHLRNGDYVTVNRMPSLHRNSVLGLEVKLVPELSIQLHLSYTTGFNADFDGDEMNVHIGQTIGAMVEIQELMNAKLCIPNDQNNAPIIGLVMDNVVGSMLLTRDFVSVDIDTWNDCLLLITAKDDLGTLDQRLEELDVKKYTGKALFSALLPAALKYKKGAVEIINGILISGTITKDDIGPIANNIIQYIYKNPKLGLERAAKFLTDAPFVLNRWLMERGLTIGIQDCYTSPEIIREREKNIAEIKMLTKQIGGEIVGNPIELERRESDILLQVNEIKNMTSAFLKKIIPDDNNFKIMVSAKSKGSESNLAQAAGTVGQQTAWGDRMPLALTETDRCMPHFMPGDTDIESRGFCRHSYSEGLDNVEWMMHSYASREGLINTAVNLSDVGDIHRKMSKCLEDLIVHSDGSIRNNSGLILQYVYGDDGFVGGQLQKLTFPGRDVNVTFFIDIQNAVNEINAEYGFF